MKKILALIAAVLLLSGCLTKRAPVSALTPFGVYYDGIYVLEYNGHEYLWNSKGGIIHSESCSCWDLYAAKDTEEYE